MRKGFGIKNLTLAALSAAFIGTAAVASAAPNYLYFFTDGANTALGGLSVTNGIATGGTMNVISGVDKGSYSLFPNPTAPVPYSYNNNEFQFDDLVFPGQNPAVDAYGLFFSASNGTLINLYAQTGTTYTVLSWTLAVNGYNLQGPSTPGFYLFDTPKDGIADLKTEVDAEIAGGVSLPDNGKFLDETLNVASYAAAHHDAHAAKGFLDLFELEVAVLHWWLGDFSTVQAQSLLAFADLIEYSIHGNGCH